jgi:hypothetical protein
MEKYQNDDHKAYGWCDLLATDKRNTYIKDPQNEIKRSAFILKMTNKEKFLETHLHPMESFTKA